MSTALFPARSLAKILAFTMALTACQPDSHPLSTDGESLRVTKITTAAPDPLSGDADKFSGSCNSWSLTAKQAEEFFRLSTPIDARTYHHEYDTSRCMITGRLAKDGKSWDFKINGGAKATWSDGETTRYFGCRVASCEPLVVFMQDDATP